MSGYGGGGGYPSQGGFPQYNNNYPPQPSATQPFPSPQQQTSSQYYSPQPIPQPTSNQYHSSQSASNYITPPTSNYTPPSSNQYNSPQSPPSPYNIPTPHHQQSSSSTSSLTPESQNSSQFNSSQFNSNQIISNQFNPGQLNSNQFNSGQSNSSQSNSVQFNSSQLKNLNKEPEIHVGSAPTVQPRRRYQTQRVKLTNGNVVIDCRVPSKLMTMVPRKSDPEFTHVRYTACTCDPNFFQKENYFLRQETYKRRTEIFIVITMYNEDAVLFARTFQGVVKNIYKLCQRSNSKVWGEDGWKKIVVCVVADGRNKINKYTKDYLAAIGVYQEGVIKEKLNDKKVVSHLFEYTTQLCLDDKMTPLNEKVGFIPVQVLFCLKEENKKKINSHRWFFNAFSRALNPTVCILLDAGTRPGGNSFYHLWKAFETNPHIGGACGEIVAMKGKYGQNLLNPLVAAQNFEYKMSNILDKPLESVFGYITVLPGAFSAYRYAALRNEFDPTTGKEVGPLASYFMGEIHHGGGPPKMPKEKTGDDNNEKGTEEEEEEEEINTGLFTANMYLAEDRILCFELVSKRNYSWVLHYVKSAYAETDVPDDIIELILQRRRWLNGSFFAGIYAIYHTSKIFSSDHTTWKKFVLIIEMIYQTFNLTFSWFALGNLYLTFHILGNSLATDEQSAEGLWSVETGAIVFRLLQSIYIAIIILQFSMALGNKPKSAKWAYIISTGFFSLLMFYMLFAAAWISYKAVKSSAVHGDANVANAKLAFSDPTFRNVVIALLSTYGLYFVASFLFFEPYHMFHSIVQYLLLVPFYVNVLNVYAFCNIHDVSWGTKGDTKAEKVEHGQVIISSGSFEAATPIDVDVDDEYERIQDSLKASLINEKQEERSAEQLKELKKEKKKEISVATDAVTKNKLIRELNDIQDKLQSLQVESNSMFRTWLVFIWMISNGILVAVVTSFVPNLDRLNANQKSNIYFAIILWSVTALAAFRFFGSCIFLILRLFTERVFDGLIKN